MSSTFSDIDCLSDIISLEQFHFDIVKENIRYNHMKKIPNTTPDILTEAFSDIIGKMGEFFKKMITSVKEFFRKFFMYINSLFMDIDKFVRKYKKELNAVDKVDFEVYSYQFTMHDEPNLEELEKIVNGYNDDITNANKLKVDEIKVKQNEFLSTGNLRELRGKILGSNNPIDEEDFLDEVRKYYRNGEDKEETLKIGLSEFRQAMSDADSCVKELKAAEKLRDNFIIQLDKAQKFFDQKAPIMYKDSNPTINMKKAELKDNKFSSTDDDVYISNSKADAVNQMIRFRYNQTKEVASIINIVVRERGNAYKGRVKVIKEIITKALYNKNTDTHIGEVENDD